MPNRKEQHPLDSSELSRREVFPLLGGFGIVTARIMSNESLLTVVSPEAQEVQNNEKQFEVELTPVGAGEVKLNVNRVDNQSAEGTCKIVWTTEGENRLSDRALNERGWGEYNCATPDGPVLQLAEWQTGKVPGQGDSFNQVFVAIRTEGGWENAEIHPITEQLISQESRETQVLYARVQNHKEVFNEEKEVIGEVSPGDLVAVGEEVILDGESYFQVRLANDLRGVMNPEDIELISGYGRAINSGEIRSEPEDKGFVVGQVSVSDEFEWYKVSSRAGEEWYQVRRLLDGAQGWVSSRLLEFADQGKPLLREYGDYYWATPFSVELANWRESATGWTHELYVQVPENASNLTLLFEKIPLKLNSEYKLASSPSEGTRRFLIRADWIAKHILNWENNEAWTLSFERRNDS